MIQHPMPFIIETEGIHPSTGLCLEAMQWLHERLDFGNILDMGCGNGILAVTAAAIWDAEVLAVDISEKALADARKNIVSHKLSLPLPPQGEGWGGGQLAPPLLENTSQSKFAPHLASPLRREEFEQVTLLRSDAFSEPLIGKRAPYDLIICNMLSEFTVETARQVKAHLAGEGFCILAGILAWKAESVETAYKRLAFEIIEQFSSSPWQCTILRHNSGNGKNTIVTKA